MILNGTWPLYVINYCYTYSILLYLIVKKKLNWNKTEVPQENKLAIFMVFILYNFSLNFSIRRFAGNNYWVIKQTNYNDDWTISLEIFIFPLTP